MKRNITALIMTIFSDLRLYGYKQDDRIPSIRDLALKYAVKPSRINRALEYLIVKDILYKKGRSGFFIASLADLAPAPEEQTRQVRRINLVRNDLSGVMSHQVGNIVQYIQHLADENGLPLCFFHTRNSEMLERRVLEQLLEEENAPAVFISQLFPGNYDLLIEAINRSRQWFFAHDFPLPGINVHYLGINHYQIGVLAAALILKCDECSDVLYVGFHPQHSRAAYLRYTGFRDTLKKADTQVYHELLMRAESPVDFHAQIVGALGSFTNRKVKIFASTYSLSEVFSAPFDGFRLGRDYFLVTVDYIEEIDGLTPTTIIPPVEEMYTLISGWLLKGVDNSYQQLIYFTPRVLMGNSLEFTN